MEHIINQASSLKLTFQTNNPFVLAKDLNIHLFYQPLGRLKGMYVAERKKRYIVINNGLNLIYQAIVCAHEIGHDRLHHQTLAGFRIYRDFGLFDNNSKQERDANIFAAEYMLDDDPILSSIRSGFSLEQIASEYQVPSDLLLFKLMAMKAKSVCEISLPWMPDSQLLGIHHKDQ